MEMAEVRRLARIIEGYKKRFDPLFGRKETRYWAREYLGGLLMNIERKNCWQIAEARKIPPGKLKSLQHFLYGSPWKWQPVIAEMARMVDEHIGSDDGVLVVDESGVRRWGKKSVGIGRQHLGCIGKTDNGQVGVYLAYASDEGSAFLDARLFIPEDWFSDPERCAEAGIPESVIFRTKPALASEMLQEARIRGIRAQWVTADEFYGRNPGFLDVADALGFWYVAEVPVNLEVWKERPRVLLPTAKGSRGRPRAKARLARKSDRSVPVAKLARRLGERNWTRIAVADGTQGPRVYDFAFLRVVEKRAGLPARDAWLVVRRSLGQDVEVKYFLSNAPADVDVVRMAGVASGRWRVEAAIKEAKGQTGLDESEGRNWNHWHHHTTLSMLAQALLTCARVTWSRSHFPPVGEANEKARGPVEEGEAA